jgi:succinate dehydrogenase / fumarate reductase, cytochrome b subunit
MMTDKRPLSPHIQIYKPQLTSVTSIFHRITGFALYVGVVLLCVLISLYVYQTDIMDSSYKCECAIMNSIIYIVSFAFAFALYYHLCNGIRHLFWDIGKGFDINFAKKMAIIVISSAFILTILSFVFVFTN